MIMRRADIRLCRSNLPGLRVVGMIDSAPDAVSVGAGVNIDRLTELDSSHVDPADTAP